MHFRPKVYLSNINKNTGVCICLPLYCSMLKSGPKKRLPTMYALDGVAVDDNGALLSEVS